MNLSQAMAKSLGLSHTLHAAEPHHASYLGPSRAERGGRQLPCVLTQQAQQLDLARAFRRVCAKQAAALVSWQLERDDVKCSIRTTLPEIT